MLWFVISINISFHKHFNRGVRRCCDLLYQSIFRFTNTLTEVYDDAVVCYINQYFVSQTL